MGRLDSIYADYEQNKDFYNASSPTFTKGSRHIVRKTTDRVQGATIKVNERTKQRAYFELRELKEKP